MTLASDVAVASLLLAALAALAAPAGAESKPAADLVVTNARVWTGDARRPEAEALAVVGERIVAVGSRAEIEAWRGPETGLVDAEGRRVLPGFNDAHVHFFDGSAKLAQVQLKDARSPEELAHRIGEQASKLPKGEWVLGGTWDDQAFERPRLPTRADVDALTPETPVFVNRLDGHMALANSHALRLAGVTRDDARSRRRRDRARRETDEPTGRAEGRGDELRVRAVPPPSRRVAAATRREPRHAAALGVTSVQDMSTSGPELAAYAELLERGELTMRLSAAPLETRFEELAALGLRRAFGSTCCASAAVKGFADGCLGSTTAFFEAPYSDAPQTSGLLSDEMHPVEAMRKRLVKADAAGLQLCIHAIGDRANDSIVLEHLRGRAEGERRARPPLPHRARPAPRRKATSRASKRAASSPRCSPTTRSTTAAGRRGASAPSVRRRRTPSARSSTRAPARASAPTGTSRRSTRCRRSTPR